MGSVLINPAGSGARDRGSPAKSVRSPTDRSRWHRWDHIEPWLFYSALLLILIPLWITPHFPSQDGPLHLYNAIVLRDYQRPDRPLFREFFAPNGIVPNWVCPHLLPLFLLWMPPAIGEKALLTIYLLLFPLSIRYCLRGVRKHAAPLAIAALPMVPNQFYHMGFQDFCLSLAIFFIAMGFYVRRRRHFGYATSGALAFLLLLCYATHLLSALMLVPMIGLIALLTARRRAKTPVGMLRELLPVGAAMVPLALASLYFLLQSHPTHTMFAYPKGWLHRFYFLISWMKGLGGLDLIPDAIMLVLFIVVSLGLLLMIRRVQGWKWLFTSLGGGFFLSACGYFAIFLFASDYAAGGQFVLVRLAAYPMFALLLWWAAVPIPPAAFRRLQIAIAAIALPALLAMLALDVVRYAKVNRYLTEFDPIAAMIPPNSTLLPIHFGDYQSVEPDASHREIAVGVDPFRHAACFGMAERGIINLSNYWASTDHHSLRWQGSLDPLHGATEDLQNLNAYTLRTGVPIDYVLIWTGGLPHDDLEGKAVDEQLKAYQLIYRSPLTGYLRLYRRIVIAQ